ncbi:MAG TPA: hypothetical protein VLY04_20895 [Bryobacteraceae bacterium]|nr:hypothetical protein [Bryobacteraceae bacterium]
MRTLSRRCGPVLLLVGSVEGIRGDWVPPLGERFEVHRVAGWQAALALIKRGLIHVVLCAQDLPDGSWRDLAAAAATMDEPPALIVVSRLADERLWAEVLNLGGYDLLAAPLVQSELARSLDLAWHHWAARRHEQPGETEGVQFRPPEVEVCSRA